jgi:AcrR family transcriptional regulator
MTEDVRAQILAAAATVFAEKGFSKTGINDIVRASGLSKGGVYWHFASKDEIVTAIFNQFFEAQLAALASLIAQEGMSATEKLMTLARQSGTDTEAMAAQFPSSLEFYALAARDTALRERLIHYFGLYQDAVQKLVEQGTASGEWANIDARVTAQTIIALFEGVLLVYGVQRDPAPLEAQITAAMTLLLEGLKQHK